MPTSSTSSSEPRSAYPSAAERKALLVFLLKGCVFLAIPVALLHGYIANGNAYVHKRARYLEMADSLASRGPLRDLILGDSHAGSIDRAQLAESTFNFARGGDSPKEMYLKLLYALDTHPELKRVWIECDPSLFAEKKQVSDNEMFARLIGRTGPAMDLYQTDRTQLFLVGLSPIFDAKFYSFEREKLRRALHRLGSPPSEKQRPHWRERSEADRQRLAQRAGSGDFNTLRHGERFVGYHRRMLEAATRAGIEVIGLRLPAEPEYIAEAPADERARIGAALAESGFTRIVDYTDLLSSPEAFEDPDHMSPDGAALLLERIAEDTGHRL